MPDPPAKLAHDFTCRTLLGGRHDVGVGPYGHRRYFEVREGAIDGLRLRGRMLDAADDWMLVGADRFTRMDVRVQIATDDEAASAAAAFSDQSIRSRWLPGPGDPRYTSVNRAVFLGEGRLRPAVCGIPGFEHRVHRVGRAWLSGATSISGRPRHGGPDGCGLADVVPSRSAPSAASGRG